jgi:molybdopterin-synthase adenylyltransferase
VIAPLSPMRRLRAALGRGSSHSEPWVDLRIEVGLFAELRAHIEDTSRGEEAGYLLCSLSRCRGGEVLLARRWLPVPDRAITRNCHGSVLSWSADFNSEALEAALAIGATPVLIHSHGGSPRPRFSSDDRMKERALFPAISLLAGEAPCGTLLLGQGDAVASYWSGGLPQRARFRRLVVLGDPIESWYSVDHSPPLPGGGRSRLDRQSLAIGPHADTALAGARVGVLGLSGGGSHVIQQLAHQGVGALVGIDPELVEDTNLGRLVGATAADAGVTPKVAVARRLINALDPGITFEGIEARFPEPEALAAMKETDLIITCLDRFDAREQVNAFCRRYLIPQIDIGIEILSTEERLASADGQLIVSIPGHPCLRCWFLTDAVLAAERRNRPPGYDVNPNAPGQPQVVSMNGVLASEAANSALDLITGYAGGVRGPRFWQYDGRDGALVPHRLPPARPGCPACAEEGLGDPPRS